MRCLWLVVAALLLACPAADDWVQVVGPGASFRVRMPGPPAANDRQAESSLGPVPTHLQVHQGAEHAFIVGYTDYPPALRLQLDVEQLLDGARDASIARVQGELVSEAPSTLAGHPGREVQIRAANGRALVQARFYVVGPRLYQVLATTAPERAGGDDVAEFLGSFSLPPAVAATPPEEG